MIKINYLIILFFVFQTSNLLAQVENFKIDVEYMINNQSQKDAKYYAVIRNDAFPLEKVGNQLLINGKHIQSDKLKVLVINKNQGIEFFMFTNQAYYLKITRLPLSFKNFFKRRFLIQQGADFESTVGKTKNKYTIRSKE